MTSHGKSRPLIGIAAATAIAAVVTGCNNGSSGAQNYNPGYTNPGTSNGQYVNTNPNLPASMNWENTSQQNLNNATDDQGAGLTSDPGGDAGAGDDGDG